MADPTRVHTGTKLWHRLHASDAALDLERLEQVVNVVRIRRDDLAPRTLLGHKGYQGVQDIGRSSPGEQLAGAATEQTICADHLSARKERSQPILARCSSPGLGDHRGGYHWILAGTLCLGNQRPNISIATVKSDESSCVEHLHAAGVFVCSRDGSQVVRARAAATSSSLMAPACASYSAMAAASRSRTSRSATAWAIQELILPRSARARMSSTRSAGSVMVSRGMARSIAQV